MFQFRARAAHQRPRTPALILIPGLLAALLSFTHFGWILEQRFGLQWLFALRGEVAPPAEVLLVDMDKQSARLLGQPVSGRHWRRNWQRTLQACLVETLSAAGAVVIAFDVLFTEERSGQSAPVEKPTSGADLAKVPPSCTDPEAIGDQVFADAIERSGRVLLSEELVREKLPLVSGAATHERRIPPLDKFATAALGTAPFPLPDTSLRLDHFWTFMEFGGAELPALPVLALAAYGRADLARWAAGQNHNAPLAAVTASGTPKDPTNHLQDYLLRVRASLRPGISPPGSPVSDRGNPAGDELNHALLDTVLEALSGPERRLLWFYGPAGTITTLPYHRIVQGTAGELRSEIEGKVVFVGATDISRADQADSFKTVFSATDGIDLSGVEIAATAFANLLTGTSVKPLTTSLSVLIVFAWGVLTVILFMKASLRLVLAGLAAFTACYLYAAHYAFAGHQLWLPLFFPFFVAVPLATLVGLVHRYRIEHTRSEGLDRAIRYYVPAEAVGEIREDGKPHQRRKTVYGVCMFSDIADYTGITETVSPEQLVELDNEYFEALGLVIEQWGGHRLDLTGDGSMSLWHAPSPLADLRWRACIAGLEIIKASLTFNERHPRQTFPTRIGLHVGWVALANIGGGGHYAFKAVGDVPPTASRIEGLNKELGTRLLASEAVVTGLEDLLLRPVGRFALKGKEEVIAIHEVRGRRQDAAPGDIALVQRFRHALDLFQTSRWREAERAFAALMANYPNDGPSQFFMRRSRFNLRAASASAASPVIRLTHK